MTVSPPDPRHEPTGPAADPLAEPTAPVTPRWTAAPALANGSVRVGWYGPLQVLLALQAAEPAPAGRSKGSVPAWVTGIGAAVSLIAAAVGLLGTVLVLRLRRVR